MSSPTPPLWRRALADLRAQYFELDRRLLGLFRIYFGLVLLTDLLRRFPYLTLFYSNDGVLPNHYELFAPRSRPCFSLFFACSTTGEVTVAFSLTALVYASLIVGYRTRTMQILTAILYPSLITRNLFFEMGGSCSLTIAASFTALLPLGDRFSVDALASSLRRREEKPSALAARAALAPTRAPHRTVLALGLWLQVSAIYFFNGFQKTSHDWDDGSAIHWVLWQNRIATWLCEWLRMHEPSWFSPTLTVATLIVERGAPIMLLVPFVWRWTRPVYALLVASLHVGIAALIDVGPYSYIMLAFDLLLVPASTLDVVARWLEKGKLARRVAYDPEDAVAHACARVLARLDTFGRLSFVDRAETADDPDLARLPPSSFVVRAPDGRWSSGGSALVDALASTPLGGLWGRWPTRPLLTASAPLLRRLAAPWVGPAGARESARDRPAVLELPHPRRSVWPRLLAREGVALLFLYVTFAQILHDNGWLHGKLPASWLRGPAGPFADAPFYTRQFQGWSMFRDPPRRDGTVIVDGVTEDGRHIDPFTGKAPDYDVLLHGRRGYGELFCDYFAHIAEPGNERYRVFLKLYLARWQELAGRPRRDRLRSFEAFWIEADSPPPGFTGEVNSRKTELVSGP